MPFDPCLIPPLCLLFVLRFTCQTYFRQLLEPVHVPVYSLPANSAIPMSRPITCQSFRSALPFRVYRAPPPFKPHLLPINLQKKLFAHQHATPAKPQPIAASHDAVHHPVIEWDLSEEAG